jgi:two-component system LytT family response regulator
MKIRALLVEDEAPAQDRFVQLLEPYSSVQLVAQFSDVSGAVQFLAEHSIDLVFLDVHLGSENGFDLLPFLPAQTRVVFITAYPEFAIRAFEFQALDYLLKPVSQARLGETIERFLSGSVRDPSAAVPANALQLNDPIILTNSDEWTRVPVEAIRIIRAAGDYTELFARSEQPHLSNRTLTHWAKCLPAPPFYRLDRSHIINLSKIENFSSHSRERGILNFHDPALRIHLGRTASDALKKLLRSRT